MSRYEGLLVALICFLLGLSLLGGFYSKGVIALKMYEAHRTDVVLHLEQDGWEVEQLSRRRNLLGTDLAEIVKLTSGEQSITLKSDMATSIGDVKGKVSVLEHKGVDLALDGYEATWSINSREPEKIHFNESTKLAEEFTGMEL